MKQWFLDRWNDPAKFIATLRTLVGLAAVGIGAWTGAPAWLLVLAPVLTQIINAGDKNEFQPTTKLPAVDTVIVPGHEVPLK